MDPESWHFNGYKEHQQQQQQLPHVVMRLVSEYWRLTVISTGLQCETK